MCKDTFQMTVTLSSFQGMQGTQAALSVGERPPLPWESHPPDPIALVPAGASHPVTQRRHRCIAAIQEVQLSALRSFLPEPQQHDTKKTLLLIDPGYHANVGDHMITVAEQEIFKRLGWKAEVEAYSRTMQKTWQGNTDPPAKTSSESHYLECHYIQAAELVPHCQDVIQAIAQQSATPQQQQQQQLLAVWHGGGNWGDLWPSVHRARLEQSFQALLRANFSVYGMPQSLYYREKVVQDYDARLLKHQIQKGLLGREKPSPVMLTWREHESFDQAQQLYPYVQHSVLPDIAFQLGPYNWRDFVQPAETRAQVDFLFLLRRDHESMILPPQKEANDDNDEGEQEHGGALNATAMAEHIRNAVNLAMEKSGSRDSFQSSFRVVDWPDRLHLFQSKDPFFTKTAIQLLAMGRVLICDRLHAAILAFLTDHIPFVYLDQSTGKISKCLRLALDSAGNGCNSGNSAPDALGFSRADNLTDAIQKAGQLLKLS
ncbi:Polysaccharide pyruvyl transferase [Seminavis robusta]|uniref:Polysaccharide pyruvyl transferase n=1 Tax=Seminavis robusta TaxID=568900 RepID=A0A9N8H2L0_9STRA|nr:Polysaccharide pyruvyl transferase [Seminavis robusta]|eukprot:Sro10_g008300.1 Polysaccharide pyruvyl transferase (487) ;mRNA; f:192493-193953